MLSTYRFLQRRGLLKLLVSSLKPMSYVESTTGVRFPFASTSFTKIFRQRFEDEPMLCPVDELVEFSDGNMSPVPSTLLPDTIPACAVTVSNDLNSPYEVTLTELLYPFRLLYPTRAKFRIVVVQLGISACFELRHYRRQGLVRNDYAFIGSRGQIQIIIAHYRCTVLSPLLP